MRIYVACLASYNNGVLHGAWIPASSDVDEMEEAVRAILRASPFPNVMRRDWHCESCGTDETLTDGNKDGIPPCPHCGEMMVPNVDGYNGGNPYPSAEEYAIHDSEGLGPIDEYASLSDIARRVTIIEAADAYGIPADIAVEAFRDLGDNQTEPDEFFSERYHGAFSSWREMAAEYIWETQDMNQVPEWLINHIDWDSIARDFQFSGELTAYQHDGTFYFFHSY